MIKIKKASKQITIALVAILLCFIAAVKALSNITTIIFDDEPIVCIDPGHGGEANGAVANSGKRLEKNDNLALSLKVRDELEAMGVKVIMTRQTDKDVSLKDRCKIANKARADLFVSIHRNSSSNGTGMEVWIKDKPSDEEKKLANDILASLVNASSAKSRGVKSGFRDSSGNNYYVNANTNMTSCLVEVGFISNSEDNKQFDNLIDTYAKSIATAIYGNLL